MSIYSHRADNVVELPVVRGKVGLLSKLNLFVMEELTAVIGFERGTYALYLAGYRYAADLAAASAEDVLKVGGMTPWKLQRISRFLCKHGLEFGMDVSEWREYKSRNVGDAERPVHSTRPRLLRLVT